MKNKGKKRKLYSSIIESWKFRSCCLKGLCFLEQKRKGSPLPFIYIFLVGFMFCFFREEMEVEKKDALPLYLLLDFYGVGMLVGELLESLKF